MRISKETACTENETENADIEKINRFARRKLTQDEVFTFSVILCDNEVDRDGECFPTESLEALAELFIGKTGITDHNWSANGQIARIYDASFITDDTRLTSYGEKYACVKALAYTLRTPGTQELISQIQGGIKKEVSVGCAVEECVCCICGKPIGTENCGHIRGAEYSGKLCYAKLMKPTDAYEWSFVAVPSQKEAGVSKQFGRIKAVSVRELVEKFGEPELKKQLAAIEKQADMGRQYTEELRREVLRLGMLTKLWDSENLKKTTEKLDNDSLISLKDALEKKADELFPPYTQLEGFKEKMTYAPETEYMV